MNPALLSLISLADNFGSIFNSFTIRLPSLKASSPSPPYRASLSCDAASASHPPFSSQSTLSLRIAELAGHILRRRVGRSHFVSLILRVIFSPRGVCQRRG